MLYYLKQFVEIWLLPPNNILLLILIGFLSWKYYSAFFGKILVGVASGSLWLFSTPLIAQHLVDGLQNMYPTLSPSQLTQDKDAAIVILESGLNNRTPEYGSNSRTISESTLARIRYGAFLYNKIQASIFVSGNDQNNLSVNQADCMANSLQTYFQVPTRWKEPNGYNTAQEGILTTNILKQEGVKKIYLVTHALHMPRAVFAFRNKGINIVPAPTGYIERENKFGILSGIIPSMNALNYSAIALHEYIGILWYRVYYQF